MNARNRIMAALTWGEPDYVPWAVKPNHLPRGWWERRLRNMGLGLTVEKTVYRIETPNVEIVEKKAKEHLEIAYSTPVGEVSEKVRVGLPSEGGERGSSWRVEWIVKTREDYRVLRYILEDMCVKPDYRDFELIDLELGGDGVVLTSMGYSPVMQLIVRYMGFRRFVVELHKRGEMVKGLLELIHEKNLEACRVIADSPAKLVLVGDNMDEVLVNPRIFEEYCLPYYEDYVGILHSRGKLVGSHMDGRLRNLAGLIAEAGFDFIHGFTPPPTGNLPVGEARRLWSRRIALWVNIPETIFLYKPELIEDYVRSLLKEAEPGDGFMLGITETVPPKRRKVGYEAVMNVILRHGRFPVKLS